MKYIEITPQSEQQLVKVLDLALKQAGFAAFGDVRDLVASVKEMPEAKSNDSSIE